MLSDEKRLVWHLQRAREETNKKLKEFHTRRAQELSNALNVNYYNERPAQVVEKRAVEPKPTDNFKLSTKVDEARRYVHLADNHCTNCHGLGARHAFRGAGAVVCNCVFRKVFKIIMRKFHEIDADGIGRVYTTRRPNGPFCEILSHDFRAEVVQTAKKFLNKTEYITFHCSSDLQLPWKDCIPMINTMHRDIGEKPSLFDRGNYFHTVYRIQARLGNAWMSHGMFPLGNYFHCHRIRFTDYQSAHTTPKGPWLNGGYWEVFRDDPAYDDQYRAYVKGLGIYKSHPWKRYYTPERDRPAPPPEPTHILVKHTPPPPELEPEPFEQLTPEVLLAAEAEEVPAPAPKAKKRNRGHKANKRGYIRSIVGKFADELPVEIEDIKQMTYDYAEQFGFLTKDYKWVDGPDTATLLHVRNNGDLDDACAHIGPVRGKYAVLTMFDGDKPKFVQSVDSIQAGKDVIKQIVMERKHAQKQPWESGAVPSNKSAGSGRDSLLCGLPSDHNDVHEDLPAQRVADTGDDR